MSWFRQDRLKSVHIENRVRGRHERRGRHEAIESLGYIRFQGDWTPEQRLDFATVWAQEQQRELKPCSLGFEGET